MTRFLSVAAAAPLLLAPSLAFASARTAVFYAPDRFDPTLLLVALLATTILLVRYLHRGRAALFVFALVVGASLALNVAFAADGATPETVAQAAGSTTQVTWAYGAAISQWAGAVSTVLLAVLMWLLRLLPAQVYSILVGLRADQLIQKGIAYGINMVQGATAGKELTVDVHNQVLAQALQYVLDHAPDWLTSWMGGPDQIAQKIVARLNLAPDAVPDVSTAVSNATPSQ